MLYFLFLMCVCHVRACMNHLYKLILKGLHQPLILNILIEELNKKYMGSILGRLPVSAEEGRHLVLHAKFHEQFKNLEWVSGRSRE